MMITCGGDPDEHINEEKSRTQLEGTKLYQSPQLQLDHGNFAPKVGVGASSSQIAHDWSNAAGSLIYHWKDNN